MSSLIVIKCGGSTMEQLSAPFFQTIARFQALGQQIVIVHGGGPAINHMLQQLNIPAQFIDGLRYTCERTIDVVEMVLAGSINKQLVRRVQQAGGKACGLSGIDGQLIRASQTAKPLGLVGEIEAIDTEVLQTVLNQGYIPVIAPLGVSGDSMVRYNINADVAAGAVAAKLGAAKLLMITDVPGILHTGENGEKEVKEKVSPEELEQMIATGEIYGGMIPKVRSALDALAEGVAEVVICQGTAEDLERACNGQQVGTAISEESEGILMSKAATTSASHHLFNNYGRWPIPLVKGSGNRVWDEQGKEYLDFTSGIAVTSLGHVPPQVTERLHQQLDTLWHTSNLFEHPLQEQLAGKLAQLSGLDRVFFCNSGAEANEAAIKLARRYSKKVLETDRYEIITFQQSFHGRTLATLTATGQDKVKDGFTPLPTGFVTVPYNDLGALKAAITERTCAIMLEMVQGEGGVIPADQNWIKGLRQLCDDHQLLLLVDEVQTGIARTGTWFAFQQYEIKPDVVSLAKGLGSGFPVGAILANEQVAEAFSPGTHGTTFGGNPLAMTAGLATLETIEQEKLLDKVNSLHTYFMDKLQNLMEAHPGKVMDVRGRGLLLGIEMNQPVASLLASAREQGVLLLQAGEKVIRIVPSFITTEAEIDQVVKLLDKLIASS